MGGMGCIPPSALLYYSEPLPTMAPSRLRARGGAVMGLLGMRIPAGVCHSSEAGLVPTGARGTLQSWVGTLLCVLRPSS